RHWFRPSTKSSSLADTNQLAVKNTATPTPTGAINCSTWLNQPSPMGTNVIAANVATAMAMVANSVFATVLSNSRQAKSNRREMTTTSQTNCTIPANVVESANPASAIGHTKAKFRTILMTIVTAPTLTGVVKSPNA